MGQRRLLTSQRKPLDGMKVTLGRVEETLDELRMLWTGLRYPGRAGDALDGLEIALERAGHGPWTG